MIIFKHPENFCGFLYFAMVGIGTLFVLCLVISDLTKRIFKEKSMSKYEELYNTNKDFKDYVDSYMRNKNVSLSEVLSLKITQNVGDMYRTEETRERKL